jgi:hypothetical protein
VECLEAERLGARFVSPEPRLLASSVYQDGGWRLVADGRRLPTVRTNGPFAGAWLPSGRHRLELLYRPRSFLAGLLLAACSLALGAVWLLPPPAPAGRSVPPRRRAKGG